MCEHAWRFFLSHISCTVCCMSVIHEQCYNVPYLSLSMFLGALKKDRDSATAYSKSNQTPLLAQL